MDPLSLIHYSVSEVYHLRNSATLKMKRMQNFTKLYSPFTLTAYKQTLLTNAPSQLTHSNFPLPNYALAWHKIYASNESILLALLRISNFQSNSGCIEIK